MWPAFEAARTQGLRDHTRTGLLLLAIGFGIGWIPVVSFLGGILALIGVILLLLGRHGFGEAHHRNVVVGLLLLFVAFIATLAVTAIFIGSLLSTARTPGATLSSIGSTLRGELQGLFLALVVIGILGSLAQVLLPYALADATDRWLLWTAFFLGAAISVLIGVFVLGQVDAAVASATAGTTYNPGPIQDLQNQDTLLGAAKVLPDLLLAYAYYRIYVRVGTIPPPM